MKARLSVLYFLQFSVWGCYLTSFGQFLGAGGLGGDIAWFYAAIGVVSLLTPSLLGRLADRTGRPEKLLAGCHFCAALLMFVMWRYGMTHPHLEFRIFYPLYLLFLGFYMPTMALANTSSFGLLTQNGYSTVTTFPTIRVWGTVGFVAAMWFVNSTYWTGSSLGFAFTDVSEFGRLRFQYNSMQLLCSGVAGVLTGLFALSLPPLKPSSATTSEPMASAAEAATSRDASEGSDSVQTDFQTAERLKLGQSLKKMFSRREIAVFLVFVMLSGVCLQISNGFATPYISHFAGIEEYAASLASGNATMLFSLSQISEAFCILLVGLSLRRKGIKWVYAVGLLAWCLRFFTLGAGNPGSGLWLLLASMIIYGIAFNFITIAGHIYIQQVAPKGMKGFAQGLMMFMSNGLGATVGTLIAGDIVNRWCHWQPVTVGSAATPIRLFMGDWAYPLFIFAAYALFVALLWLLLFPKKRH